MNFNLTQPCDQCPFRTDITFYLRAKRVDEILEGLFDQDRTFACHKTVEHGEDGEAVQNSKQEHCAGALILMERESSPNQLMRIAERVGHYDHRKLNMDAPVFEDRWAMEDHYQKQDTP